MTNEQREEYMRDLRSYEKAAAHLRSVLGLHQPNELLWEATRYDDKIEVRADGYGKFTTHRIEEIGGCSYLVKESYDFDNENDAIMKAEELNGDNE